MAILRHLLRHLLQYWGVTIGIHFGTKGFPFRCKATLALQSESLSLMLLIFVLVSTALLRTRALITWPLLINNPRTRIALRSLWFHRFLNEATFACQLIIRNLIIFDRTVTNAFTICTSEIIVTFAFSCTCFKDTFLFLAYFFLITKQACITIYVRFATLWLLSTLASFITYSTLALKIVLT